MHYPTITASQYIPVGEFKRGIPPSEFTSEAPLDGEGGGRGFFTMALGTNKHNTLSLSSIARKVRFYFRCHLSRFKDLFAI